MKIYDISVPLQAGMPVWPGDSPPEFKKYSSLKNGDVVNSTSIHSSLHLGTHVDAPRHLYDNQKTIDMIPLEVLVGRAIVLDMSAVSKIDKKALLNLQLSNESRILFKTKNSEYWKNPVHSFEKTFVSLTTDAAQFLIEKNVKLVGIDYLSIDLYEAESLPVHKILLEKEIVIIEGLNLHWVPAGIYDLYCLPLKIVGADGSPARAMLKSID
jgi:arylformamidase